jgi:hypothetical protein
MTNDLLLDILERITKPFTDVFWSAYLKAGAPYGETDEGFARWLKEINDKLDNHHLLQR